MDEPTQNKFIGKIRKAISEIKTYLKNISASEKNLVKDISTVTMQLDCLQNIADLWAKGVANSMNEFERLTKSENADSTANETVAYSKKVKYNNSDFSKALDAREWKKFNNLMTTGNDTGLRISPTSLLVECENDSPYIYKYVRYNELSDDIVIEDVYAIGKIDTNYEDNVQFQARTIANVINELEEIGYDNRQYVRKILASYIKNTSYVLAGYSNKTSRYNVIGRGSRENGTNTFQKSDRAGSLGSSQENGDKFSVKTSSVDSEGNKLTEAQQEFYKNSVIRDAEGRIKPFYHGTARADRVGNYFNPERATSGPMAYFTDNQKIAENYSRDKTDTSLAYDSEYDSYETQFRVNVGGKSVSIVDYWKTLPIAEKNKITQKAEQLTIDDDYENLILKPGNKYGNGGFDLRYARENALQALVDSWLASGYFMDEEERFLEVLQKVGIENAEYKNPNYREEKVYKVYLNITNPLYTKDIDNDFIADLEDYIENADMSIYESESSSADMWDKNDIDIYDWIERLRADVENGTTHAWTSIPDVITDFLKDYGNFDGIVDQGGKNGGEIHTVAIPFYSNQIKNIDNLNPTDSNDDIRYSVKTTRDKFRTNAMIWANSADTKVGDTKILFGGGKGFALLEATENGYIEIARGDYDVVKGAKDYYERTNTAGEILDRYAESLETERRRNNWHFSAFENTSNERRAIGLDSFESNNDKAGINEQNRRDSEKFSVKSVPNNRVLLSNALETVTQNDIERKYIRDYKAHILVLEEQQEKLKRINEEIGVLSFAPRQKGYSKA